jgi:2-succinyl-5-enolpyruvyl-6-hydroxy-3-cyclohexene-1-carboxylate synthase
MKGKPIVGMMAILQESPNVLMGLKSSGIKELKDLNNKNLALYEDISAMTVLSMLKANRINYKFNDVIFGVDKLISKEIDMATAYITNEPFIARELSKIIPDNTSLVLSSSMPIRDVDLYSVSGRASITVAANRGVSGIDGVISTASGFATAKKQLTTLLIGDMAFIHDINALAVLKKLDVPVIVVVINNRGGGIFHFLPISQAEDIFEDYFAVPHDHNFKGACETFGIDYYNPQDKNEFTLAYLIAKDNTKPAVIEINTDRNKNLKLRRKIKKQIIEALEK